MWANSWRSGSSVVRGTGVPPDAGTRNSGVGAAAKMIWPSVVHVPPRALAAALTTTGAPPARSNRKIYPRAKNATDFPSGDQNGCSAPSLPSTSRGDAADNGAIQSSLLRSNPEV